MVGNARVDLFWVCGEGGSELLSAINDSCSLKRGVGQSSQTRGCSRALLDGRPMGREMNSTENQRL